MSKFNYTDDEMEINKVLKMNQNISNSMLENYDLHDVRKKADNNINASIKLLNSLGKSKEIEKLADENTEKQNNRKLEHRPKLEDWEIIAAEADVYCPDLVVLEDIMTEAEIQQSFKELSEIELEFSKSTSIVNKTDLAFLVLATALQVIKSLVFPYIAEKFGYGKSFDPNERLAHNDKSIEKAHKEANDKFRDKQLKKHETGHWINLLYQTPPYDITTGSKELGINMGGKYHRMYTLGHDPILGWLFGTANILTDCITFNDFHSNRVVRVDPLTGKKKMIITPEVVGIGAMFKECYDEVKCDFLNLPAAVFAQAQHLKSDKFTKLGLPVPFLSSFNENFASKLYKANYDAICCARDIKIIGASFFISRLIDIIIGLVHGLFWNGSGTRDLYEVRTRKILLISSTIATTSTVINAGIMKNPKKLDLGGLLNTVTHLFLDIRFIAKVKQEFIESEISNRLQKEIAEIEKIFEQA